jgi:hypothetical protein
MRFHLLVRDQDVGGSDPFADHFLSGLKRSGTVSALSLVLDWFPFQCCLVLQGVSERPRRRLRIHSTNYNASGMTWSPV